MTLNDQQPTAGPASGMPTRRKVAYALSAAWVLLGLTSGIGGVVVFAALLALGVGIAALIVGRARWAFITSRKVGAAVAAGALVAAMIGGAASATPADEDGRSARRDASPSASPSEEASSSPKPSPSVSETPTVSPTTTAAAEPAPAAPAAMAVTVTDVVDGDTVDVSTGDTIRVIGIDAPESGACGYAEATHNLEALALGKAVTLTAAPAKDDRDRYGRLLRYVDVAGVDNGLDQINKGFAIARYDSRDGYGAHPREQQYIAADQAAADFTCQAAPEQTQPPAQPAPPPPPASSGCHSSYVGACLPIGPDLDCADVPNPVQVVGTDEYRLDADHDGWGCESS